jgi:hypothetical protein
MEYKFNLSENQKKKIFSAIKNNKGTSLRLSKNNIKSGDFPLLLTDNQINKVNKAINNNTGIDIDFSKSQLQKLKKHGGFLPFLPLILGGLSAIGSLVAGGSQIAKAVNQAKSNEKQLQETKRHNELMESKLNYGSGLYKKCNKCHGKGLFLGRMMK